MPYQNVWIDPPYDMSLPVHKEAPDDVSSDYCEYCGGWVAGGAFRYHENTLDIRSGRRGVVFYCRRCGKEIDFIGVVS